MNEWLDDLLMFGAVSSPCRIDSEGRLPQACVLVSVVHTRGSCPRDAGTRMVIALDICHGTIGGGHLEYQAIVTARELLLHAKHDFRIERFPLGARVGQCCGGVVHLSFEYIPVQSPLWVAALKDIQKTGKAAVMVTAMDGSAGEDKLLVTTQRCVGCLPDTRQHQLAVERALKILSNATNSQPVQEDTLLYEPIGNTYMQIVIFGAGHVGKALVNVLSTMPCRIRWIDSRAAEFPNHIPANVQVDIVDQPEMTVDDLPAGSHVVVMTHSHALDRAICERALNRDDPGAAS
jgi:xanthine dehydrogenase accessory factor